MKFRAVAFALALAAPAHADDWFLHEYGELRAFHGDWTAVCNDAGAGDCRVVQTQKDPGSDAFFDSRLSLLRRHSGSGWTVELMDRGLINSDVRAVTLSVDGTTVPVDADDWTPSRTSDDNAIDSLYITGADVTDRLVALMRPGAWVTLGYDPASDGDGMAAFSLRGVTAAMGAVDAQISQR